MHSLKILTLGLLFAGSVQAEGPDWVEDTQLSSVFKTEFLNTVPGFKDDFRMDAVQLPTALRCLYSNNRGGPTGVLEFPLTSPISFELNASKTTRLIRAYSSVDMLVLRPREQLSKVSYSKVKQNLIKCLNAVKSGQLNHNTKILLPKSGV